MKLQKRKDGTIKVTAQSKEDSRLLYQWLAGVQGKAEKVKDSEEPINSELTSERSATKSD